MYLLKPIDAINALTLSMLMDFFLPMQRQLKADFFPSLF